MEMNIASAQQALRQGDADGLLGNASGSTSKQAAPALSEALGHMQGNSMSSNSTKANGASHSDTTDNTQQRLQLIDEHQEFHAELGEYLQRWHLQDAGFDYNLCAVVGSQSTGKSTLLNKLFGTSFDVMNENERKQTTKGESAIIL